MDTGTPTVGQWGIDAHNNRRLTARQAGLATADMARLELAWTMAFPQTANMRAQPVLWATPCISPSSIRGSCSRSTSAAQSPA